MSSIELVFIDRMKAWAVPVICAVVAFTGNGIINSVNRLYDGIEKLSDKVSKVDERQIRTEEQVKAFSKELEEVKEHIAQW